MGNEKDKLYNEIRDNDDLTVKEESYVEGDNIMPNQNGILNKGSSMNPISAFPSGIDSAALEMDPITTPGVPDLNSDNLKIDPIAPITPIGFDPIKPISIDPIMPIDTNLNPITSPTLPTNDLNNFSANPIEKPDLPAVNMTNPLTNTSMPTGNNL